MPRLLISNVLGLVGAVVGGVLGFYIFRWLLGQGFYGLMIPGALLGLGCSLLARHTSMVRGVICGVAALGLALFTDWYFTITNDSFLDFVKQGKSLSGVTLLMTVVGALIAFWVGKDGGLPGYSRTSPPPMRPTSEQESRGTG
jgi:hypothetical protein